MMVWPLPRVTFQELTSVKEARPTALITDPVAWASARRLLNLPIAIQAEPTRQDIEYVDNLTQHLPTSVEVVYVVGDGMIVDVGRYVAGLNNKPLVIVPTVLSTDEAFLPTASVMDRGTNVEIPTGPAQEVILDLELIRNGPAHTRATAIVDVLSIITSLMDWTYATQKNAAGDEKLVPWVAAIGAGLAQQALKIASALGQGDVGALRTLVDLLCMMVQLENQVGHRRLSHGIEHVFADAVKPRGTTVEVSHAERVALGILLASALHNKDGAAVRTAMEAAGVRLNQLRPEDVREAFLQLPEYAKQQQLSYTLLNDLQPFGTELGQALTKSALVAG